MTELTVSGFSYPANASHSCVLRPKLKKRGIKGYPHHGQIHRQKPTLVHSTSRVVVVQARKKKKLVTR